MTDTTAGAITSEVVTHLASLARIALTADEIVKLTG
jgi:aspartyl-tRNA(Asn)/glutamyl-tRNA(Gln) amidotransferase subunit C